MVDVGDRGIEDETDVENYSHGNSDSDDPGPEQAGPGPVDNQSTVPMRPSNPAPCNHAAEVVLSRRYVTAACSISSSERLATKATIQSCLLYTSPSPRDATLSRMPSSA